MQYPTYRLSSQTTALLAAVGLRPLDVESLALRAIEEDIGDGVDCTTIATVPSVQRGRLDFITRGEGVIAGQIVAAAVLDVVCGDDVVMEFCVEEGSTVTPGTVIMWAKAQTHALLRAERPALNLLGHLSGVATATAEWVRVLQGTPARVRDTRKTTPGLRAVEKYAVRMGGGINHRMNLADAALVKDNHVLAAGGIAPAFAAVRKDFPQIPVEVEVDTLEQLDEALRAGAELILLDNFSIADLREAVVRNAGRAQLEASGGLTLARAAEVASTGVDFLAVGALTHSAPVLDIGADLTVDGEGS
jgi:nicotinate-nucleotide pyrophosphorylase (carboxylating)